MTEEEWVDMVWEEINDALMAKCAIACLLVAQGKMPRPDYDLDSLVLDLPPEPDLTVKGVI